MQVYNITPVAKPRMTQRDKWAKRQCVLAYRAFADEARLKIKDLPIPYHAVFVMPMPKSWRKKKRADMCGQAHQQRPDKDNLEKALLDALFEDDSAVWDGRVTKIWGETGRIIISEIEDFTMPEAA